MKKTPKVWLYILILLGGFSTILGLEAFIRISTHGPKRVNSNYVEMSAAFTDLDALITDSQIVASPKYYDEFIYAPGPLTSDHINFTDYFSSRLTPDSSPITEAEFIIWSFGGSTMENTETTDRLTIANTLAKKFNERLGPSHVKNFGTGGFFSSYELIKFQKLLREVPENELPHIAIFYDGFNDAQYGFQYGPGSLQKDLSLKIQALVEHEYGTMWIYMSSKILSKYSKLWEQTGARWVENKLFPLPKINTGAENLHKSINVYNNNFRMTQATCEVYNIHCYFILQPLIVTKNPLSELEQLVLNQLEAHPRFGAEGTLFIRAFYSGVINELASNDHFIDASHILDGRTQSDFYDVGHTSALSSPIIGDKLADLLLERLQSSTTFATQPPTGIIPINTMPPKKIINQASHMQSFFNK
jgi:hypothetical protein